MLARLVVCLCRQQPQTLAGPVGNTVETAGRQADDNSVLTRSALEIIRAGIYQILHESKLFRCQLLQFFGYQKQVLVDHIAGLLLDTDTGVCCGCSFCSCGCHLSNIFQSLSAFGQIKKARMTSRSSLDTCACRWQGRCHSRSGNMIPNNKKRANKPLLYGRVVLLTSITNLTTCAIQKYSEMPV